jgi:acetate kinase
MNVLAVNAGSNSLKFEIVLKWIEVGNVHNQGITDFAHIERVGHRVVHGADAFRGPARLLISFVHQIGYLGDSAPLHNRSSLAGNAGQEKLGSRTSMFAVFDTVFHQSIPELAALYPLPLDLAKRHRIRR